MTVVNPKGDWEIELRMRENRSGHLRRARDRAQQDPSWATRHPGVGERVTFVLATDPGTVHKGTIREIKGRAEVQEDREEKNNVVEVKVDIDQEERQRIGPPRPGTSVTAQVYCGRRACGYVWFHEAWEWVDGVPAGPVPVQDTTKKVAATVAAISSEPFILVSFLVKTSALAEPITREQVGMTSRSMLTRATANM